MIKLGKEQPVASMDQSSGKVRCRAKRGKNPPLSPENVELRFWTQIEMCVPNRSTADQIIANWHTAQQFQTNLALKDAPFGHPNRQNGSGPVF